MTSIEPPTSSMRAATCATSKVAPENSLKYWKKDDYIRASDIRGQFFRMKYILPSCLTLAIKPHDKLDCF